MVTEEISEIMTIQYKRMKDAQLKLERVVSQTGWVFGWFFCMGERDWFCVLTLWLTPI